MHYLIITKNKNKYSKVGYVYEEDAKKYLEKKKAEGFVGDKDFSGCFVHFDNTMATKVMIINLIR